MKVSHLRARLFGLPLFAFLLVALAFALPQRAAAQGCPMCKSSIESSIADGTKPVGKGINAAILYLMAVPFAAVGTIGGVYYMKSRRMNQG